MSPLFPSRFVIHACDETRSRHLLVYPSGTVVFNGAWVGPYITKFTCPCLPSLLAAHHSSPGAWSLTLEVGRTIQLQHLGTNHVHLLRAPAGHFTLAVCHVSVAAEAARSFVRANPALAGLVSSTGLVLADDAAPISPSPGDGTAIAVNPGARV